MVTVGMNYEVLEGKQEPFEKKFALVVQALGSVPGHITTHLYQQVENRRAYLVVSEWASRDAFESFVGSEGFRKTASWGSSGILAGRPRHQVFGGSDEAPAEPPRAPEAAPTPPIAPWSPAN